MNIKERLYHWLYKLAYTGVRDCWLERVHTDIVCPQCKEWRSISEVEHDGSTFSEHFGYMYQCGKCNGVSYWNTEAFPMPVSCSSNGAITDD